MNFILAMLLIMLLPACASTEFITVDKVIIPELDFPEFPVAGSMTNNRNGTVTVPADWLVKLEEYHIKIQETEDNYNGYKEIYARFYGTEEKGPE